MTINEPQAVHDEEFSADIEKPVYSVGKRVQMDETVYRLVTSTNRECIKDPCGFCDVYKEVDHCVGEISEHCSDHDEWNDEDQMVQASFWKKEDPLYTVLKQVKESDKLSPLVNKCAGVNQTKEE